MSIVPKEGKRFCLILNQHGCCDVNRKPAEIGVRGSFPISEWEKHLKIQLFSRLLKQKLTDRVKVKPIKQGKLGYKRYW